MLKPFTPISGEDRTTLRRIELPIPPRQTAAGKMQAQTLTAHCRHLIAEGADPDEIVEVYRDGTPCFQPMTLGRWADLTVSESENVSIRWAKYTPFPTGLIGEADD